VNQRVIAMVNQRRHWKQLQRLPFPGYISPSKTAFAMAPTVIATARCKITTAVAMVILRGIIPFLNNNNSTVNQPLN